MHQEALTKEGSKLFPKLKVFIDFYLAGGTALALQISVFNKYIDFGGLKILDVLELSATKAYTIGRRGSFKDYVDLFFILSGRYAGLEKIIELAEKKYGDDFNSRLFLEQLIYLEDVEEEKLLFLKKPLNKKQLEKFFVDEVRKIHI